MTPCSPVGVSVPKGSIAFHLQSRKCHDSGSRIILRSGVTQVPTTRYLTQKTSISIFY
jgi:hypothetical protein